MTIASSICYQKFSLNYDIREILLATDDSIIAEAAPKDKIWGIGRNIHDKRANDVSKWNGTNILGWALMDARERIREDIKNQ